MTKKQYNIRVDNPCMQDWASMEKSDKGRYCMHCAKTVIDFTKLSDRQAIQQIERNAGNLCGRFRPEQLSRSYSNYQSTNNTSLYKFLTGLLLLGASKQVVAETNMGIKDKMVSVDHTQGIESSAIQIESSSDSTKNTISGIVLDASTREQLAFATINIKNTNISATTDLNGAFKLIVPDSLLNNELYLIVSFVGFRSKELYLNKNEFPMNKEILLVEMEPTIIGVVVVIEKKKWWQFWK